ncbi:NAD(P)/FAD-dependent oxidoreductase [Jeotgalicoccus nanhaiensis]|uniref:NAD(P)/FAD-dependent oxidoreductase n=1 Tax=Jeotgalicoccus nanhaiensis TaxID=568603 RepID=A0ABR9XZX2_9STAP|nr:NAD(P)/FAD-dependent oxidoreductase [Jeotgalicoccus nanhaiensis]MBF0754118.1 NAD(P)/FAD-dependent oxidoreductase [Jeotgalicoccus nanhaiensis]TFU61602.1 NAD(P)/FAD-dependent oxidoreductase [Jeotgalicoccus nanhaiensis]
MYDTIVIGGGVSGIMAAYAASLNNNKVLLIEKNKKLGKKLLISGGGRCNVTNRLPYEEIIKHIPGNGKFLYGPFSVFDNESIINFVESNGVKLKEEDHGRMFPVSNKAKDVLNVFLEQLDQNKVDIRFETEVAAVLTEDDKITGVKTSDGDTFNARNVIITTGGKSVPQTGSTGDGHKFAKTLGHTVTDLFPTEVPITSNQRFFTDGSLKGISLDDVALSVLKKNGKPRVTHQMDMIFTHFGVSGPAALRCSQFVYKEQLAQKKENIKMQLDFFPQYTMGEMQEYINKTIKDNIDKSLKNILKNIHQERLINFMLEYLKIDGSTSGHHVSNQQKQALVEFFKRFTFNVNGTQSIEKAFVTGGGVNLKEINPSTMSSKLIEGLHFAGEVLDIHGYTGGYNITSALVTGYVAGYHCSNG